MCGWGGKEAEEHRGMGKQSAPGGNSGRLPVPLPHYHFVSYLLDVPGPPWMGTVPYHQKPTLTLTRESGNGSKLGQPSIWAVLWPQMFLWWAVGCHGEDWPRREVRQWRTASLPPEAQGPVTLDALTAPARPPAGTATGSALRPCWRLLHLRPTGLCLPRWSG